MPDPDRPRARRERSVRYPGVALAEAIEFVRRMESRGLDGLMAESIAAGLGYGSIKTNTFSARLSASRQFGLLSLKEETYTLTQLARGLLHPLDAPHTDRLHREALASPPLYADLLARLSDRKVPEPAALANMLYHQFSITSAAKDLAAACFLESCRSCGLLSPDGTLRTGPPTPTPSPEPSPPPSRSSPTPTRPSPTRPVRLDLPLWGPDSGKQIRLRCPDSITPESFERFLQAFRLHVRIEPSSGTGESAT